MEELKKLIDVLELKGKGSASALLNYADDTNLETRLFHLVKDDELHDEALIAEQLYSTSNKVGAYKMLKSRVKKKLYNQLLFADIDNEKVVDKLFSFELKCRRYLYLARILRLLGEGDLAEQQLKKALSIAEEVHLVKYQIDALEQLRALIAYQKFSRKFYEDCVSKLEELYIVHEAERKANAYFFDIRFNLKMGVEANQKFVDKIEGYINEVGNYLSQSGSNSSLVFQRYHGLKIIFYELNGDAESLVLYLEKTFSFLNTGKIHPLYFSVTFNKFLLVFGYLRAKQYSKGLREAEQVKNNLLEGSQNWFAHMENYFLLAVHSKLYRKAEEVMNEVLSNKYLTQTTTFSQERWQLFYRFLNYVSGFVYPTYTDFNLKHVIQDKKGYNVWRLILEFIVTLEEKKPELIEREIDRVRKFASKYLTSKEDARNKTFLKLLQIAGRDFSDSKIAKRKGAYLFNKLQQIPIPGIAYAETEIVPYEHLWELILTKMEIKK